MMDRPKTPDELHRCAETLFGMNVSRRPMNGSHAAPFDYLVHAFFEGAWTRRGTEWSRPPSPARPDCVVWANRGGGKTALGALATAMDLVFKPAIEIRILGGSLEQSKRMHAHLRSLFAREATAPLVEGKITSRRLCLRNRASVELLAQSEASVRGTRVQKLRCDEVELFDPDVWQAAQLTTRGANLRLDDGSDMHVPGVIECLSTMHRPFGLMADIVGDPSRRVFRWGITDVLGRCPDPPEGRACEDAEGPCPMLAECAGRAKRPDHEPGHITVRDALSLKSRVSKDTWDAEMLCLRPSRSDSVYPEFSPEAHVTHSARTPPRTHIAGMDFGFRGLTVILLASVGDDGVVTIEREHAFAERRLVDHLAAIADWPPVDWIGVDPAGLSANDQTARSNVDVLRDAGFSVRTARRPLATGIRLVHARLAPAAGAPTLRIHRRCEHLIQSLTRYHYDSDNPTSTLPVKDGPDHACDALRYMIQNLDGPETCRVRNYTGPGR